MPLNDESIDYVTVNDATGVIIKHGSCRISDLPLQIKEGESIFDDPGNISDDTHYWDGNKFKKYPKKPTEFHEWNGNSWFDPRPPEYFIQEENNKVTLIRNHRNMLLSQTDWTQLPDSPLDQEKKAAWSEYRQQLRDIVITDPDKFTFPQPPY